jgi:hypothetical protein
LYWSNTAISKSDIVKLTKDDVLIIFSGTNDMEHNSITIYNKTVNFINRLNHTNIILLGVPFRYDLPASSLINREIEFFNRKLVDLKLRFSYIKFF